MPPLCPPAPGLEDLVSQLNQDPRAESISNSGIGTTAMEEDIKCCQRGCQIKCCQRGCQIKCCQRGVKDETSCVILNHSSGPDDLMWDAEIPYLEIMDDSTTVCKTPVVLSTLAVTPAVDAMLSPPESLGNKKQCKEAMVERLLKSTEIGEPDYKDAPLVRYTRPDLSLSDSLDTLQGPEHDGTPMVD